MKQLLNMESLRITSILVLLYTCSVSSFPSRPLNERSTDLTWQAWLFVDDQNQEKNYSPDTLGRRRITPKSVFIAPTLSTESLPPCASGYQSDSMGRCIKLIEIDREEHLNFLLEKLNERFGNSEDYSREDDEDNETSSPGPIQLNIPLDEAPTDEDVEGYGENIDFAIVVTPTNGKFRLDNEETEVKKIQKKNGEDFADTKNVRSSNPENLSIRSGNSPISLELTESVTPSIKTSTDFEDLTTKTELFDKTLTTDIGSDTTTTDSFPIETTTNIQQALFFREPIVETKYPSINEETIPTTSKIQFTDFSNMEIKSTTTDLSTNTEPISTVPKKTTTTIEEPQTNPTLPISSSTHHHPIRVPTSTESIHSLQMYANQFRHMHTTQRYYTPEEEHLNSHTPQPEFVFKNRDPVEDAIFRRNFGIDSEMENVRSRIEERSITPIKTRRNIEKDDKNPFLVPVDLNISSPPKHLVFRFHSRKTSRRLLSESVQQPQKVIFREISPEYLKVLFGDHRHKRKSNR